MLREEKSGAAAILMDRGLRLADAREAVAKFVAEDPVRSATDRSSEVSVLIRALNQLLDRLSVLAANTADAHYLLAEIRERAATLERQLGDRSE